MQPLGLSESVTAIRPGFLSYSGSSGSKTIGTVKPFSRGRAGFVFQSSVNLVLGNEVPPR